jgi:hypothetical protein
MTQEKDDSFSELNARLEKALDQAYRRQINSFRAMYKAVAEAKEAGWSNREIGMVIGMTEGGVRLMLKRRSKRQYYREEEI